MEDQDPDTIDHDIYDEIVNLERWQDTLSDLIATNGISQEDYDIEMLKARYYLDLRTKNYTLEDDDAEILRNLRKYKESLNENYKMGIIDEEEFNRDFINILRKEYEILRSSESDDGNKVYVDLDTPLEEKLQKLHLSEVKYNKRIAKENGIPYPKLPIGIKGDEVDDYYYKKMSGSPYTENVTIENYLKKLHETNKLIGYHTSSYEIQKIVYNSETNKGDYEFKMVAPMSENINSLKMTEGRAKLLNPNEEVYSQRLIILKNKLRQIPRQDLLKCIGVRTFRYMSYIERLRQNKQFVFKFRENPEDFQALRQILQIENDKFYKISSDVLFKDYVYSRPDIDIENVSNYQQKGQVAYLAFKKGINLKNMDDSFDNFVTIKPLDDPLYTELNQQRGSETEVVDAWELRTSLPGSDKKELVKRYLSFEDYLLDLKDTLIENSKGISGKSRDILKERIRKISHYLNYSEDLESVISTGQIPLDKLFQDRNKVQQMRRKGIYELMEYITRYYPGAQVLSERAESDVFNYSSSNYIENINKLIFIFKNFSDKLSDFVERDESIVSLLTYETPKTLPEDDIDLSDKNGTIEKILQWRPISSNYDNYKSELESSNHDFKKFKQDHIELSSLQISEIMSEYSEKIQWDRSLQKYSELEAPEGYIELNYRLRFILRERNKLPSRRIYRVAKVAQRMSTQRDLAIIFNTCKIEESGKYSILAENIIIGLSKSPEDYFYYSSIIKKRYDKLCQFFNAVKPDVTFEPSILIPVITEFLITEGDFDVADIDRLRLLTQRMNNDELKDYIYTLRGDISEVYVEALQNDNLFEKVIKVIKSAAREERLRRVAMVANNIYKPPTISLEKPIKKRFGLDISLDYIKVGDNYVYGGYYPTFYQWGEEGELVRENYSRADIEQLAIIFNITIIDDSFELYTNIMNFIAQYNNTRVNIERLNFSPVEYETYYEYLKTKVKTINYTIRPRLGIPDPGEVFAVTKDDELQYGVPFDFNEDSIPIYSSDLKQLADDSFIIIEGPAIFADTSLGNRIISDSYILIEYLDSRGKPKVFREGVAQKKIIKRPLDKLDTCSRFTKQETCDNPNSFSLEIDRLKFKCKWLDEKCKGIAIEDDTLRNFNLNEVKFDNPEFQELFNTALNTSVDYIESIVKERDSTRDEISLLSKEQKHRLYNYYLMLLDNEKPSVLQEEPKEEFYSLIDVFDVLKEKPKINVTLESLDENYKTFTIYDTKPTQRKLPLKRIIIDNEYRIDGMDFIVKSFNEDGTVNCVVKDLSEEVVVLERSQFRSTSVEIIMKTSPIFCYVSKEDFKYLKDAPGYYWYLKSEDYKIEKGEVKMAEIKEKKTFVPPNYIHPSKELNGRLLITRDDIFSAMNKTAFCELATVDDFVYNITSRININEDAIDFALKNRVDVVSLTERIVGTITLPMVLEEYERIFPKKFLSVSELTDIISKAIEEKDKKTLMDYYVRARRSKLDKDLLKEAKNLIKTLADEVPVEEPKVEPVVIEPVVFKSIYTAKRRR